MTSGFQKPAGADAPDWYKTVEGEKLKIGFSKFGEMIDSISNIGLQYGDDLTGRDPFAPPAGPYVDPAMPKFVWQEGWFINITYSSLMTGTMRNVWAMAMHGDLARLEYGNGWVRVDNDYPTGPASESEEDPRDVGMFIGSDPATYGLGGRKTNGTVVTEPIKVLCDSSDRFIARCVNHVYDWIQLDTTAIDVPLVDVIITIDFNKARKEVTLLREVEFVAPEGVVGEMPIEWFFPNGEDLSNYPPLVHGLFVQFSSRAIWDLGKPFAGGYKSYVHFYTEGDMTLPCDYWLDSWPIDDPWVEGLWTPYGYDYAPTTTIFPNQWSRHGPEPNENDGDTFDLAQMISNDEKYVGFAAYWPSLSDWSVNGLHLSQWWKSLTSYDKHSTDVEYEPWMSPNTIGEWDFMLSDLGTTFSLPWSVNVKCDKKFTSITAYGLTDLHLKEEPWIDYEWNEYWSGYPRALPVYVGAGHDNNIDHGERPPELSERWDVVDREVASELAQTFVTGIPFISTVESATGAGTVAFESDTGSITGLESVSEDSLPTEGKPDLDFPNGFFSFNIIGIEPGATVTLTIILPSPVPLGTQYWKCQDSTWYQIPIGDDDGDNVITIQLTDGGLGDSDGVANGVIVDPGGIGLVIIHAMIDFNPDTLNLKSNGEWITCYIELPGYDVNQISIDSIKLTISGGKFSVDPSAPTTIGDYDGDGIPDLMVKFDRLPIVSYLGTTDYSSYTGSGSLIQFTVTGTLTSWIPFKGSDTVTVIKPGK